MAILSQLRRNNPHRLLTVALCMFPRYHPLSIFTATSSSLFTPLATAHFLLLPSTILIHVNLSDSFFLPLLLSLPHLIPHIHSCWDKTRGSGSFLHFPIISAFRSFISPPPSFSPFSLSILSAAGLITGCHKWLMFSQKVLAAPRGPQLLLVGGWQLHLQARGETHISGERVIETQRGRQEKRALPPPLFHLSFDWTVIVMCGPHCMPVKGRGINKWCNYMTLMWHHGKRGRVGEKQEGVSGVGVCLYY